MKRLLAAILACALLCGMTACGGNSQADTPPSEAAGTSADEPDSIQVDEGLLHVEITLPATLIEDETEEDIRAAAEENGFLDCTIHEDGSVTYTMTRAKQSEMLEKLKAQIDTTIDEMINGEDAAQSFQKVEYTNDLRTFDVYVDSALYKDSLDALYSIAFLSLGIYYQVLDGTPAAQVDVTVNFIDQDTQETLDTLSYQDILEAGSQSDAAEQEASE